MEYEILTLPFVQLNPDATNDDLGDLGELDENEFRGFASVFGLVVDAWVPTIMKRGAFTKTLQERSRQIPILWQHDMGNPIGSPTRLFETDEGLVLQAKISRTTLGRDALTLMRDGVVNALSIGFDPIIAEEVQQEDGSYVRFIKEARLVEVSVVTLGADPNALITEVRSGCVAGRLEQYNQLPTAAPETPETVVVPQLVTRFSEHVASLADSELAEYEIVEQLAEVLRAEAGPETPPTSTEFLAARFRQLDLLTADLLMD